MKLKFIGGLTVLAILFSLAAFADEPVAKDPEPKKKKESKVKVEGKIYSEYKMGLDENSNYQTDGKDHGLAITRAYVTLKGQLNEIWSANITMDAGVMDQTGSGKDSTGATVSVSSKSKAYEYYIKNAYAEAKIISTAMVGVSAKFGMIGTPIIGLIDKVSDYRWIYNNYIDKSSNLVSGTTIDHSADLGASVDVKIAKMVTVTYAVTNGEGYKTVTESYRGKAQYVLISVNPIKPLFVNLFGRTETYAAGEMTNNFYGAGLAYDSDLLKVGANVLLGTKVTNPDESSTDRTYSIVDIWLNVNLKSAIGMPILVFGRFATGSYEIKDTDLATDGNQKTKASDTTRSIIAFGVGYQFNSNVRMGLYYELYQWKTNIDDDASLEKVDTNKLYVKAEAKF